MNRKCFIEIWLLSNLKCSKQTLKEKSSLILSKTIRSVFLIKMFSFCEILEFDMSDEFPIPFINFQVL